MLQELQRSEAGFVIGECLRPCEQAFPAVKRVAGARNAQDHLQGVESRSSIAGGTSCVGGRLGRWLAGLELPHPPRLTPGPDGHRRRAAWGVAEL